MFGVLFGEILFRPQKCRHQWRDRAVAETIGQSLQAMPQEIVPTHDGSEAMRPFAAIAAHAALGFQPLEQLLHGGHLGIGHLFVDGGRDVAAGRISLLPDDFEDREFPLGNRLEIDEIAPRLLVNHRKTDRLSVYLYNVSRLERCQQTRRWKIAAPAGSTSSRRAAARRDDVGSPDLPTVTLTLDNRMDMDENAGGVPATIWIRFYA